MLMNKELTKGIIKDIIECFIDSICFWRYKK